MNDWINIEDRLPENENCIMIYSKTGGVAEGAQIHLNFKKD